LIGNDWVTIDVDGDGEGDVQGSRQGILRGDFGTSLQGKGDVFRLIVQRIPKTLQLTLTAFIVGYLIGIPIGVYAATHPRGWFDQASRVLSVVGNAIPGFWLALILILIFSVHLGWLTTGGTVDFRNFGKTKNDLWYQIKSMIMPVTVLSLGIVANISRFMRTETLEVLEQDYIRTARAKGLNNQQVWWGHAVRNALIPIATFIGPALGGLLGGAVITEQIFGWPGMGRLTIQAVFQRDFPLIMASLVISSVLYIVGLIVSDVLYAWVDPRIRY
jgi:peptide/nickel transport system permease protein